MNKTTRARGTHHFWSVLGVGVLVLVTACAPAAPSPTAAPPKPTEAPKPAAPAAKPPEAPAAKPAEAKPAASPAAKAEAKPAEAKPAASPAAKPSEAKPAAPGKVESVRLLLDFPPNAGTHTFLLVGREKGFFREAGLEVDIQPGTGSFDTVKIVGAGQAPIGLADAGSMSVGVAQDVPVTMVAAAYQKTPVTIFSLKNKNITKPQDLEGKNFGVASGTAEAKVFPAFARKNNLDLAKIKIVDLSFPTRVPSLVNGNVDALGAFVTEQQNIRAAANADVNALKVADYGIESYGNGFIVNNDFAARNPQVVERFVAAAMRSLDYTLKNRQEGIDITLKALPNVTREAANERTDLIGPFFESDATKKNGLGWMEESVWRSTQDIMVQYGGQTKAVDLSKLYTTRYLKRA